MRQASRIAIILDRIKVLWEKHPDLRLGQIISASINLEESKDLFYIEDYPLLEKIEELFSPKSN